MDAQPPLTAKTSRAGIFSWCLYDWANSAFPTIVTTFIIAAYFTSTVARNPIEGTAQWGYTITMSGVMIALLSPIVGSVADYYGRRKPWLMAFTGLAVIATFCLWWVRPDPASIPLALGCVILGTVGFEVAAVFYNAMLHDIVPPNYYGRVSGWGWGLGYLGGVGCLLIALLLVNRPEIFSLNPALAEHVRLSGPLVAVWFVLFSIPLLLFTPDLSKQMPLNTAIRTGTRFFIQSLKTLYRDERNVFCFLIAHMIYIDGMNSIFAFGGIYAAGTFGFSTQDIILFGLALNLGAGIGAAAFAWLDDWMGAKRTILLAITGLLLCGIPMIFITTTAAFWAFGILLSLFVGPVQASSRSLLARIAPADKVTEAFGLFAFSGKATAFLGPWAFGLATLHMGSQRYGMATTMLFLLVGATLLIQVHEDL